MKSLIILTLTFCAILTSCKQKEYFSQPVKKIYAFPSRYSYDQFFLREDQYFTRVDNTLGFKKKYFGKYTLSNDTISFIYEGRKKPEDNLPFGIITDSTLAIPVIYEIIKPQYSDIPPEEFDKIKRRELLTTDTTLILYEGQ